MSRLIPNSNLFQKVMAHLLLIALIVALPVSGMADKKKKKADTTQAVGPRKFPFDPTKLAWPSAPAIARIRWVDYFAGIKIDYSAATTKPKASWMDRLAGAQSQEEKFNPKTFPYQLIGPTGIAVDSKGLVYVSDQRVGAIFIFDAKTHDTQLIRNGFEARFGWLTGLAIDDDDRLFVADSKLRHILIFNAKHEVEGQINEGLIAPVGLAIDTANRFLYVADPQQDQIIVYDADSLKLLRRIGTGGKQHTLVSPGDFGAPEGVALDQDGNVYVADTLNDRVEIFDADGTFISTFGKNGDGPGFFARPKGISIDSDGHIWVADQMNDRLQVFDRDGRLLTFIGQGHGELPGQFKALVGVAVDKQNRVFTTEQYPGRVQEFQYIPDAEAAAERAKRDKASQPSAPPHPSPAPAAAPPAAAPAAPNAAPAPADATKPSSR